MIWWCSARDVAWTWSWQAYPGVWLLVAAVGSAYVWAIAQLDPAQAATQRQRRFFADYPLYALYELAPPIGGISAAADQLVGGLIMKLGSAVAVITGATIIFFRWHAVEGGDDGSVVYRDKLPGYEEGIGDGG